MEIIKTPNLQETLEAELDRLKNTLNMGYELKVLWLPTKASNKSGEVKTNLICIYDEHRETAIETLKHEFIDYLIAKPYLLQLKITNKLIESINEIAYQMKEDLVEKLCNLVN